MTTNPKISGIAAKFPWPDVTHIDPHPFFLDGGGHHLVIDLIKKQNITRMVEIGCFLGGSSRLWLDAKPDLTIVGIDPWAGDWVKHIKRYAELWPTLFKESEPADVIANLENYGPYLSAMANLKEYEDRFIPVKGMSPAALSEVEAFDPQLIYIDAGKRRDDLDAVHAMWPNASLCGDDWTWGADQGFPMQKAVNSFMADHGFSVSSERCTWVLSR